MNSKDIRQSFLDFFTSRDHRAVRSAPLVPQGDPTLMFTNAGMVQFKNGFLGLEEPPAPRAVSVQRCLRVSGKHNDLENVGPSPRHHTFFEMLGNFSFGDYFKEEAIRSAWELVTKVWGLDPAILYATVFEDDDEAAELWARLSTLPPERILRCGAKDNFWQMGDTGPCGPCSEIFVDLEPGKPAEDWDEGSERGRYLEIWNLVFMQYDRDESGTLNPLPNPSIDTGAGLERVAAVLQGKTSNYDSDVFQPLLAAAAKLAGTTYGKDADADTSLRVIADHLRSVAFLLADGVIPAPDGRGYVLRRLLRRAVRHGMRLGFEEPFLHRLVATLEEEMGEAYPELVSTRQATEASIREEEEKYLRTCATGEERILDAIGAARKAGKSELDGETLFRLYDTYGQEIEMVREIAEEERFTLDEKGFEKVLEKSRAGARVETEKHQKRMSSLRKALALGDGSLGDGDEIETAFAGYDLHRLDGVRAVRLARLDADGHAHAAERLAKGERGVVVVDRTVFYAEGGGQVGDRGRIAWQDGGTARVTDTQKDPAGTFFHFVEIDEGELAAGDVVTLEIDAARRLAVERHHTATHILHAALHEVLGEGARQAGSLVAPERLRFDFTYSKPMTDEELRRVEDICNAWIQRAVPTAIRLRSRDEAMQAGAMALFGEKYGEEVRTVEVPGLSLELCGGCHVRNSGEIGLLLVTGERGVASGVRRIEAVTGEVARERVREESALLRSVGAELGAPVERLAIEAAALKAKLKEFEKETAKLRMQLVSGAAAASDEEIVEVAGVKVQAREVPPAPVNELRDMADALRDKMGSGVVVLATRDAVEGKVMLVVTVSKDLTKRLQAGKIIKPLAGMVGGGGGGRPDFAQAGGKKPDALPAMLGKVAEVVGELLG